MKPGRLWVREHRHLRPYFQSERLIHRLSFGPLLARFYGPPCPLENAHRPMGTGNLTCMTLRLGIDEAGRGCVLGPMVYAGCLVEESLEPSLFEAGVRDSKKLSAKKRGVLRPVVEETATDFQILPFSPAELDVTSLNELGKRALVLMTARFLPDVLVFDAPVPPKQIPGYIRDLRERLTKAGVPETMQIIGENGADDRYACCAAASILAKTHRDSVIATIEANAGRPIGSGYPGDPKTVAYLKESYDPSTGFPPSVRTKWETARRIVAARAQQSIFPG